MSRRQAAVALVVFRRFANAFLTAPRSGVFIAPSATSNSRTALDSAALSSNRCLVVYTLACYRYDTVVDRVAVDPWPLGTRTISPMCATNLDHIRL